MAVHAQITRQALRDQVGPRALDAILRANLAQDGLRGQVGHPEYHFDDNAIPAGRLYIEAQRRLIPPALRDGDAATAWAAFGRLSHTAQDFYAHTNYIALFLSRNGRGAPLPPSGIDPIDPELDASPDLRSGKLYYPQEALYYVPALRKFALSFLPRDSHAHMNLDSAERGPHFEYAYHAAVKRTRLEFDQVAALLAPDLMSLFRSAAS
ncbi:MAG: hypothetical protein ACM3QS_15695 [Bacteroidota bacterium]